jgi:hemolysin III
LNNNLAIPGVYSPREEFLHAVTHGIGVIFSIFALIILTIKAETIDMVAVTAVMIYAISMLLMFGFSTLYHSMPGSRLQPMLKMLDHSAIYFKIAGTYTPFALITLPSLTGLWVMIGIWGAAFFGTFFKVTAFIKKTGKRFSPLSLGVYLAMGWASIFMIGELIDHLKEGGIDWVIAGGLCYTVGAVFYSLKKLPYTHTIWHLFVLAGAGCHFISIYYYVI